MGVLITVLVVVVPGVLWLCWVEGPKRKYEKMITHDACGVRLAHRTDPPGVGIVHHGRGSRVWALGSSPPTDQAHRRGAGSVARPSAPRSGDGAAPTGRRV